MTKSALMMFHTESGHVCLSFSKVLHQNLCTFSVLYTCDVQQLWNSEMLWDCTTAGCHRKCLSPVSFNVWHIRPSLYSVGASYSLRISSCVLCERATLVLLVGREAFPECVFRGLESHNRCTRDFLFCHGRLENTVDAINAFFNFHC